MNNAARRPDRGGRDDAVRRSGPIGLVEIDRRRRSTGPRCLGPVVVVGQTSLSLSTFRRIIVVVGLRPYSTSSSSFIVQDRPVGQAYCTVDSRLRSIGLFGI